MPYIQPERRPAIDECVAYLADEIESVGELNYAITSLLLAVCPQPASYTMLNELVGAVECVKQEFYRRAVVPYEEAKIAENGDVQGYSA